MLSPVTYIPCLLPSSPWSSSSAQPTTNGDFLLEPVNPFSIDELEAALPPLQPSDSGQDSNQVSGRIYTYGEHDVYTRVYVPPPSVAFSGGAVPR